MVCVLDIKEDLFTLSTVIQALWECLASETNQLIVVDVLHHLYFPVVKPYLMQILRYRIRIHLSVVRNSEEHMVDVCYRF